MAQSQSLASLSIFITLQHLLYEFLRVLSSLNLDWPSSPLLSSLGRFPARRTSIYTFFLVGGQSSSHLPSVPLSFSQWLHYHMQSRHEERSERLVCNCAVMAVFVLLYASCNRLDKTPPANRERLRLLFLLWSNYTTSIRYSLFIFILIYLLLFVYLFCNWRQIYS